MRKVNWIILVGGDYGAFKFRGTEAEAEALRRHKANWEHAVAKKRLADDHETQETTNNFSHPAFKVKP